MILPQAPMKQQTMQQSTEKPTIQKYQQKSPKPKTTISKSLPTGSASQFSRGRFSGWRWRNQLNLDGGIGSLALRRWHVCLQRASWESCKNRKIGKNPVAIWFLSSQIRSGFLSFQVRCVMCVCVKKMQVKVTKYVHYVQPIFCAKTLVRLTGSHMCHTNVLASSKGVWWKKQMRKKGKSVFWTNLDLILDSPIHRMNTDKMISLLVRKVPFDQFQLGLKMLHHQHTNTNTREAPQSDVFFPSKTATSHVKKQPPTHDSKWQLPALEVVLRVAPPIRCHFAPLTGIAAPEPFPEWR